MKNLFKLIAIVFAFLFAWAVYLEHNDPDASNWYLIYAMAAIASALFAINGLTFTLALFLCLLAMVGASFLWPLNFEGFIIGKGDVENIERGRQASGLLFSAVVMLVFALRIRFEKRLKI